MRVDVIMPQMGESIAEGTITRWIKQVGDTVERDEPIFEISTDKVDAEIPAPSAGTLVEIKNQEGETVPVNDVVAFIETDASAAASAPASTAEPAAVAEAPAPTAALAAAAPTPPAPVAPAAAPVAGVFVSPVVRRIAAEHGIDPTTLAGTGAGGRVTKKDIQAFIASGAAAPAAAASPAPLAPPAPVFAAGSRETREPMTMMRKKIAEHMIESRRTSAHVNSVFEVDLTNIGKIRAQHKAAFRDRHGVNLTYMPFIIKAVSDALRDWPIVNSSVEGDTIVYKKDLNIGIAVALEGGLIVPVIRNADDLSIAGIAKRVFDLADRARTKKLNPDEVQGGTFTITNPGQFGGLYGLPIISQPQVAILGIGGIEKRPVVIDDAIAIRSMVYMALSYDHRVVDGAVADQFLAQIKRGLQEFDASLL
ncbi:MAG: 2-oxoglutarate dehydrogenase, E2 component, dihydrolipoamide succinyltransferase [Acidobacteriota bacterium]|nr:2-oxoglutarate dehydrogenase, E2 component, dihydrolipoamide succinyltransferase [Acidobacteriota bacterium]